MSLHLHAHVVLHKYGCKAEVKAAARTATVSGDYVTASTSTLTAGSLSGRSIDEYGLIVEDKLNDERKGGFESSPEASTQSCFYRK